MFFLMMAIGQCNAQIFHKNASRNVEKRLFGKTLGKKKEAKIKEPRSVVKSKKKQEANDRKLKKDYDKSIRRSQKRTLDIQTPEVQARMKQNKKTSSTRDKEKRKKDRKSTKKAEGKYK